MGGREGKGEGGRTKFPTMVELCAKTKRHLSEREGGGGEGKGAAECFMRRR